MTATEEFAAMVRSSIAHIEANGKASPMKVIAPLTKEQALRLECLRLAVANGNFRQASVFYDFVLNDQRSWFLPVAEGYVEAASAT